MSLPPSPRRAADILIGETLQQQQYTLKIDLLYLIGRMAVINRFGLFLSAPSCMIRALIDRQIFRISYITVISKHVQKISSKVRGDRTSYLLISSMFCVLGCCLKKNQNAPIIDLLSIPQSGGKNYIQRIGYPPEKTTLHHDQSRSCLLNSGLFECIDYTRPGENHYS